MTSDPTIFVVDDDEAVRDSLEALLESAGLSVEAYASGRDFLDACDPARRGCLLLDVRMPDMDGLEVQQILASRRITLPVIIISGHGDVPIAVRAIRAGAVDFIEKPFTEDKILDTIRGALELSADAEREEALAEEVARRVALLTPREREVLEQLIVGRANKAIAFELGISPRTVEVHRARVMDKMQARSLSHLVRMALTAGLDSEAP